MTIQTISKAAGGALALALFGAVAMPLAAQSAVGDTTDASFQSLDANHDGHLSRSEIPKSMTLLRSRFSSYDLNQDGYLDPQEFAAAKAAIKGGAPAAGAQGDSPRQPPPHPPGG
ncbi:MAG TPA: hypothetical protein VGU65_10975 [Frateuria sp.]|uniref:hypothetical protein n=1 Tax=Frateuria sp. TaxID=2211372 RepID=UPI002DE8AF81|nr:hypothetical protein [Frateuria sp.]